MNQSSLEKAIFEVLCQSVDHRHTQLHRLAAVCSAVLLAGTSRIPLIARRVAKPISQAGRIAFVERVLSSLQFSQTGVYQPLLKSALRTYHAPIWHLVIDRSQLVPKRLDLLMVSLSYHKRAVPLAWQIVPNGCTNATTQITLLRQIEGIVPLGQRTILHGDTEFGAVAMMQYVRDHTTWDFIFGQPKNRQYQLGDWQWHPLQDLVVTPSDAQYLANIFWTKEHMYGPINLFAFYKPRRNSPNSPLVNVRYCTTSLPVAHTLRRLGSRRWSIEPSFKDFKSSGWQMVQSDLQHTLRRDNLLLVLCINYLWATATGRWLCKVGRRHEIDSKKTVTTVYFA